MPLVDIEQSAAALNLNAESKGESKDDFADEPAGESSPESGLESSRAPRRDYIEIPLQRRHKCDGSCTKMVPIDGQPNVYRFEIDTECDLDGKLEGECVHIESFDAKNCDLESPDDVVIRDQEIYIEIDYPLREPVEFTVSSTAGFTRRLLIQHIAEVYEQIYAEEDETVNEAPALPQNQRGNSLNRNTNDGKYGIWGHDLGDLVIEGIRYHPGERMVTLDIGS